MGCLDIDAQISEPRAMLLCRCPNLKGLSRQPSCRGTFSQDANKQTLGAIWCSGLKESDEGIIYSLKTQLHFTWGCCYVLLRYTTFWFLLIQNDLLLQEKDGTKWCMQWLAKCGQPACLPWSALQMLEHSLMLPERNNVTQCGNGLTLTPNCHPGKFIPFWKLTSGTAAQFSLTQPSSLHLTIWIREKNPTLIVTCLPQLARALSQESAKAEAIYVEHLHVSEMIDLSVGVTSISIHCAQFSLADIGPRKEYEKNIKMPQTQGPQDVGGLDVTDSVWSFRVQHFAASILQAVCLPTSEQLKGQVVKNHE